MSSGTPRQNLPGCTGASRRSGDIREIHPPPVQLLAFDGHDAPPLNGSRPPRRRPTRARDETYPPSVVDADAVLPPAIGNASIARRGAEGGRPRRSGSFIRARCWIDAARGAAREHRSVVGKLPITATYVGSSPHCVISAEVERDLPRITGLRSISDLDVRRAGRGPAPPRGSRRGRGRGRRARGRRARSRRASPSSRPPRPPPSGARATAASSMASAAVPPRPRSTVGPKLGSFRAPRMRSSPSGAIASIR